MAVEEMKVHPAPPILRIPSTSEWVASTRVWVSSSLRAWLQGLAKMGSPTRLTTASAPSTGATGSLACHPRTSTAEGKCCSEGWRVGPARVGANHHRGHDIAQDVQGLACVGRYNLGFRFHRDHSSTLRTDNKFTYDPVELAEARVRVLCRFRRLAGWGSLRLPNRRGSRRGRGRVSGWW